MDATPIRNLFQDNLSQDQKLSEKQKQVLKAALDLFAAQGFANTTTKQIASLANVSEGTVYKRFKTKEQLLAAVLQPLINESAPQAASEFQRILTERPFANITDLVTTIARDRFKFIVDPQKEIRIIISEILRQDGPLHDFLQLLQVSIFPPLYEQFDQLKLHNKIVNWDNNRILHYIFSIILGYGARIVIMHEKINADKVITELAEFLERGLAPQN